MIKVMIRNAAGRRGLKTASKFGEDVGFSRRVAARIWKNDQLPKLKTLDRICAAWGCKLEELVVYKAGDSRNGHTPSPPPKQQPNKKIKSSPRTTGKLSVSKRSRS